MLFLDLGPAMWYIYFVNIHLAAYLFVCFFLIMFYFSGILLQSSISENGFYSEGYGATNMIIVFLLEMY